MGRKKATTLPQEEIYEIKSVLEYEQIKGKDYYLVEWNGFPLSEATWEPRSNFVDVGPEILSKLSELKESYLKHVKKKKKNEKETMIQNNSRNTEREENLAENPSLHMHDVEIEKSPRQLLGYTLPEPGVTESVSQTAQSSTPNKKKNLSPTIDSKSIPQKKRKNTSAFSNSLKKKKKNQDKTTKASQEAEEIQHSCNTLVENLVENNAQKNSPSQVNQPHESKTYKKRVSSKKNSIESDKNVHEGRGRPRNQTPVIPSTEVSKIDERKSENTSKQLSPEFIEKDRLPEKESSENPFSGSTINQVSSSSSAIETDASQQSVRVKSIRQDAIHGLCGILSITLANGETEELRLPISKIRVEYADKLIEFLLQRIQFRSVRPSSTGTQPSNYSSLAIP